jgi:hypothetical protein
MKRAAPYLIVVAGVAFAVDTAIQSRSGGPDLSAFSKPTEAGIERRKAVEEILKSLDSKTTKEKIESIYDGAVKTHEIGFPQSRSKPPPSE